MAKTAKRLTYAMANRLFNTKGRRMDLSLHNDGLVYTVRNQDGDVLFSHEEYLTCVAWIRRQRPSLGEWAQGFAPADGDRVPLGSAGGGD